MLGIIGAMPEEVAALRPHLRNVQTLQLGGREFLQGLLADYPTVPDSAAVAVVVVVSRIGKVAAATTATILLERFGVTRVLFTGIAGGLAPQVGVGDMVVATALMHHDLDASPLFPPHEVPLLGVAQFATDPVMRRALVAAAMRLVANLPTAVAALLPSAAAQQATRAACVHEGLIVSGDQFIDAADEVEALQRKCPGALAVEMEGAAVAQVCYEHGVPFAVVRAISDSADHAAHVDFSRFLEAACQAYTVPLVLAVVRELK